VYLPVIDRRLMKRLVVCVSVCISSSFCVSLSIWGTQENRLLFAPNFCYEALVSVYLCQPICVHPLNFERL
jgi:hypothetical protein